MPRPAPTTSASLLAFAGSKAAEQLRQASEVTERRRRERHAASDELFASRMRRAPLGPRRVDHGPKASNKAGMQSLKASTVRRKVGESNISLAFPDDEKRDVDLGGTIQQLEQAFRGYGEMVENASSGPTAQAALQDWLLQARTCCVCIESIRSEDHIWSCPECAMPTHLSCVQSWASKHISFVQGQNMKAGKPWSCPSCHKGFDQSEYPKDYFCFCGKEADPRPDPWMLAHSCGDICDKKLPCGHRCKLLCHPGKCPPCPLSASVSCRCGALRCMKRCGDEAFSCGKICGKALPCGHSCNRECHEGECGRCEKKVVSSCACGKKKKLVPCADSAEYRCENICGKLKLCGVHRCDAVCCPAGACAPCPTEKTCACGRTRVELDCHAPAPRLRCEHTCNKLLDCKKHRCVRRCHDGACAGCDQVSRKTCRCGALSKDAPCGQELRCDRKCNKVLNCGRHKCHKRCCDGNCPPCAASCERKLDCGVCRCSLVCGHGGFDSLGAELYNCPPCTKKNEVGCFCGDTRIMVPCGLPKKPPPCLQLCRIPPTCHHESRKPHRCHYGLCPPCDQPCGVALNCGHACQLPCHDHTPELDLTMASWAKRSKNCSLEQALMPLMPAAWRMADVIGCPPCKMPVRRECVGKHVQVEQSCGDEHLDFSCSAACGNYLPCGNHLCQKQCHRVSFQRTLADFESMLSDFVEDETTIAEHEGVLEQEADAETVADGKLPATDCGECELPCMRPRPPGCKHKCLWPCHFEACPPCFELVQVRCFCEQTLLTYACCEVLSWPACEDGTENPFLRCDQYCHKKFPSCPHMCSAECHSGPCPPCSRQDVNVRCSCGNLKKQLPCAEVWIDGKKLVLDCTESCTALAEARTADAEAAKAQEAEAAKQAASEELMEAAHPTLDIRERRAEKRKKREQEADERVQRENALLAQKAWRRRCRMWSIILGFMGLVAWLLYLLVCKWLDDLHH